MKKIILSAILLISVSNLSAFGLGDATNLVSSMQSSTKSSTATASSKSSDLIGMLTNQLGVSKNQASGGVGSILKYAKNKLPAQKYSKLASSIPNANSLMSMAPQAKEMMGGFSPLKGASSAMGMASLASQFSSLGLKSSMISKFIPIISQYLSNSNSKGASSILSSLF